MTDMYSSIDNSVHNVAVIGYHDNGTLIYMDPEEGMAMEADPSEFGTNYNISISGCN